MFCLENVLPKILFRHIKDSFLVFRVAVLGAARDEMCVTHDSVVLSDV